MDVGADRGDGRSVCRSSQASFPAEYASAARSRALVADACRRWGLAAVVTDAEIVVTELVENAVRHGGGARQVDLIAHADALTIRVRDDEPDPPTPQYPAADQASGRGLLLVAEIGREWGVDVHDSGKTVWATVAVGGGAA